MAPGPMEDSPSDHSTGDQASADMAENSENSAPPAQHNGNGNGDAPPKPTSNAKDPSRPRRKKARRACFACQRAHLTCGDERPCQRCIKRGLQDACHDGVRKKAKYLHDAPNEALMPGIGSNVFNNANTMRNDGNANRNGKNVVKPPPPPQSNLNVNANFYNYQQSKAQGQMPPPMLQDNSMTPGSFHTQSPVSPTFSLKANAGLASHSLSPSLPQPSPSNTSATTTAASNPYGGAFFDPSDPALFNFDLASMNFGNHYGALEFGMLGHMATGASDTPPSDSGAQQGSIGRSGSGSFAPGSSTFVESPGSQPPPFMYGDPILSEWPNGQNLGGLYGQSGQIGPLGKQDAPHAFAIESAPVNFASPGSSSSPQVSNNLDESAFQNKATLSVAPQRPVISTPNLKHQSLHMAHKRRQRNPSTIYESVKEPYSYTTGFHKLTAFIQRRFSPQKTVQIAKALASIRPSFIATTKTLNQDDLIFMEKSFQRTLWEYEDFINACGTPTIVCRRTGEIAAVGKEFSILTGWKKDVLLGKEPNLNINTGGSSGQASVSSRGSFTPRQMENPYGPSKPQPVFLAELLDDNSVIEFYEDFAKLAFGDSRGSVMTTCKLLKYKTKDDTDMAKVDENLSKGKWGSTLSKGGIAGEAGMNQLGFKDGKVECSYCWTVKRDMFDIPMLIVMNFLPCI